MGRTVAALYQSRAEAEFARARLISEVGARTPRIIGKDTVAAVDGLGLSRKDAESYRAGLSQGGHLLVAQVPRGRDAKQLVELLREAIGKADEAADVRVPDTGVQVDIPKDDDVTVTQESSTANLPKANPDRAPEQQTSANAPAAPDGVGEGPDARDGLSQEPAAESRVTQEDRLPLVREESRTDEQEVPRGGARTRAFTRETPVEADVDLREEAVEVESRESGRQLKDSEVQAGGLFTERVFEFAEMREEPVVTKEAFVREELIIRKRVNARSETVRDTVRHTEVEVEERPGAGPSGPAFFGHTNGAPRR